MKNYLLSVIFLSIIFFPLFNSQIGLVTDIKNTENRKMSDRPELKFDYLDPFPGQYEKYYNDNFTIRSMLIKQYNLLNVLVYKKSPIPEQLIIGKDNFLFTSDKELKTYINKDSFNIVELQSFKKELEYRADYLNKYKCEFYFMIIPTKASIYQDKLPNYIFKYNKKTLGEQLLYYLKSNCNINSIDLYKLFRSKKSNSSIYRKSDNHWTELGAYYASNEFLKDINVSFPNVTLSKLDDYFINKIEISNGNLSHMLSDVYLYKDTYISMTPKFGYKAVDVAPIGYKCVPNFPYLDNYEKNREIIDSKLPKILIISDSFGDAIFPFLAEHFSRTTKIFDGWQYKLNEEIYLNEKPDVFLLMIFEANLRNFLSFQSRLKNN